MTMLQGQGSSLQTQPLSPAARPSAPTLPPRPVGRPPALPPRGVCPSAQNTQARTQARGIQPAAGRRIGARSTRMPAHSHLSPPQSPNYPPPKPPIRLQERSPPTPRLQPIDSESIEGGLKLHGVESFGKTRGSIWYGGRGVAGRRLRRFG